MKGDSNALHMLFLSPNEHVWGRSMPGSRKSILVSHIHVFLLPRHINRKLNWKQNAWNLTWLLMWVVGISNEGFTQCITKPVPHLLLWNNHLTWVCRYLLILIFISLVLLCVLFLKCLLPMFMFYFGKYFFQPQWKTYKAASKHWK